MNTTNITLVGALVAFAGVMATAIVAFVGKRGELTLSGLNSLTDQLQEERVNLKEEVVSLKVELAASKLELAEKTAASSAALAAERAQGEAENARLRRIIVQLGGDPA